MADSDPGDGGSPVRSAVARGTRFVVISVGVTLAVLALAWLFGGFAGLGLDDSGAIALSLGVTFTVALAVGLMTLIFYGDREE
jgi:hypothetical protein